MKTATISCGSAEEAPDQSRWPIVPLGELMQRSDECVSISPEKTYQEVTVRLWGKGVVARGLVSGTGIAASRRMVVREGQFILSRIDARNGALGIVPKTLDGAVVSNDFPVFNLKRDRILPQFLHWMVKTARFVEICGHVSEGTTNRVRMQEGRFLATGIPLPPISEQRRIVARIEALAETMQRVVAFNSQLQQDLDLLLNSIINKISRDAPWKTLGDVAPLVRRPVKVDPLAAYPELGIRSFGRGTFHKPDLPGIAVGAKKLYRIEPNDLLFSNVFAWEGAIAVAKNADAGRVGSHRFISCIPQAGIATPHFLCKYLLTREGLQKIGKASPGGAGRNRTLGLEALARIPVPIPSYDRQRWFDAVYRKVMVLAEANAEVSTELHSLMPAILDKAFKGYF